MSSHTRILRLAALLGAAIALAGCKSEGKVENLGEVILGGWEEIDGVDKLNIKHYDGSYHVSRCHHEDGKNILYDSGARIIDGVFTLDSYETRTDMRAETPTSSGYFEAAEASIDPEAKTDSIDGPGILTLLDKKFQRYDPGIWSC